MVERTATLRIRAKDQSGRATRKASRGFSRLEASIVTANQALELLQKGGEALARTLGAVVKEGVDAAETANKFNTVFGDAADTVRRFSTDFGALAGLSMATAQELVANTGAITQGLGFTQQQSAETSQAVLRLAGDLASFNNVPTKEAVEAINAALTGENERLKQLAIVVKEAETKERALAITGKETASALTNQEKATAKLQLITERAGVALGDLERTSESTANQLKQAAGNLETLKESVGLLLNELPILSDALQLVNKQLREWADAANAVRIANDAQVAAVVRGGAVAEAALRLQAERVNDMRRELEGLGADTQAEIARLAIAGNETARQLSQEEALLDRMIRKHRELQLARRGAESGTAGDAGDAGSPEAPPAFPEAPPAFPEAPPAFPEVELSDEGPSLTGGLIEVEPEIAKARDTAQQTVTVFNDMALAAQFFGDTARSAFLSMEATSIASLFGMEGAFHTVQGSIAKVLGGIEIARGVADLAAGIWPPNPAAFKAAGQHFAAAAKFARISGGGVGGGGRGAGATGGGPRLPRQPDVGARTGEQAATQPVNVTLITPNQFGPDEVRRFSYEVNRFSNRDGVSVLPVQTGGAEVRSVGG